MAGTGKKLSRDDAMAMKIRLAEKDQQLLQTQEYIQVCLYMWLHGLFTLEYGNIAYVGLIISKCYSML